MSNTTAIQANATAIRINSEARAELNNLASKAFHETGIFPPTLAAIIDKMVEVSSKLLEVESELEKAEGDPKAEPFNFDNLEIIG